MFFIKITSSLSTVNIFKKLLYEKNIYQDENGRFVLDLEVYFPKTGIIVPLNTIITYFCC